MTLESLSLAAAKANLERHFERMTLSKAGQLSREERQIWYDEHFELWVKMAEAQLELWRAENP